MRHPNYRTYLARTKAGRAWINAILDGATSVTKIEIDLVDDDRSSEKIPVDLLRKFIEIDGRDAALYQVSGNEYVYLTGGSRFGTTKYVIRTYAFDVTDLPEIA